MASGSWHDIANRIRLVERNAWSVANVLVSRRLRRAPAYMPTLLMFITYRCNLRCRMCGVCEYDLPKSNAPELSAEECKAVVRSAAKLGTTLMLISGGEPLIRPDVVYDTIRCANDLGIAVHLCTNGLLLDEASIRRLGESGVKTVSVSIDSPVRGIHESLRGPDTFDRAVAAVRLLRESAPSIQVGINHTITTANFRSLAAMVPFAESLDVQQLKFAPIHTNLLHKQKRVEHFGDLLFKEENLPELERELNGLIRAIRRTKLMTPSPLFLSNIVDLYANRTKFRCFAGYATCTVNPVGSVAPCPDMDGSLSVRDRPLDEIWRSREFDALRKRVDHCQCSCWDTLYTEISLRLQIRSLFLDAPQTWRELGFYFGKRGS